MTPLVVIEIGPVVAEAGTVTVMLEAEAALTVALTPLKETTGEALKLVPVMITVAPTAASAGEKFVIVGEGKTVKFAALSTVIPLEVTAILPVVAPAGTAAVMLEAEAAVTVAVTPLKETTGEAPKLVPLIVMLAPGAPLVGVNAEMTGVGSTVKFVALEIVTPFTVTERSPVEAPAGTCESMLPDVKAETVALVVLNMSAGVVRKLVPVIDTGVPTAPLVGVKPVMVGVGNTVKLEALEIVTPFTLIEMGPLTAPVGTEVVIEVVDDAVTTAAVPLKETVGVVLKLVPVMTTVAPIAPLAGVNPVIVGVPSTEKFVAL